MSNHSFFNTSRFTRHLKVVVCHDLKVLGISAGVVPLVVFLLPFFSWHTLSPFIFIGGLVYVSTAFQTLNRAGANLSFMMLPVSTFEKCLAKWLLSGLIYPLWMWGVLAISLGLRDWALDIVGVGIQSTISITVSGIPVGDAGTAAERLAHALGWVVRYSIVHSIFFWGSIVFRKGAFLKTALLALGGYVGGKLILLAVILLSGLMFDRAHGELGTDAFWTLFGQRVTAAHAAITVLLILLIPLFLVLAYRRLRTLEV